MSTDVTLPALGESVTEGTVTRWLKSVGDAVAADEPLVEISTDKVDTEIPSPVAGTLVEIVAPEDATVEVGAVLARIGGAGAVASPAPAAPAAPEPAPVQAQPTAPLGEPAATPAGEAAAVAQQEQPAPVAPAAAPTPAPAPAPAPTAVAPAPTAAAPAPAPAASAPANTPSGYVTPIVRKLAAERGVDLATIRGTGVGGRIRKEDVLAAAAAPAAPAAQAPATQAPAASAAPAAPVVSELRGQTVKMSRIR